MEAARSSLKGMSAPKAVGQQISEAHEGLPLRRRVRETVIEADIKDERFACRVADGPKIADGVAPEKRLREVPHFTGERKVLEERMRNRKRLSELASPNRVLCQFGEEGVRVIVKSFHVRASKKKERIGWAAEIELRCAAIVNAMEIADGQRGPGTFTLKQNSLGAEKHVGHAVGRGAVRGEMRDGFCRSLEF